MARPPANTPPKTLSPLLLSGADALAISHLNRQSRNTGVGVGTATRLDLKRGRAPNVEGMTDLTDSFPVLNRESTALTVATT
jgi:hypothetical protein